jgi:hypothetical protein
MQQVRSHQQQEHESIGSIVVPPGKLKSLHLGMYEDTMPEPEFRFELKPNQPDAIVSQIVRLDRGDHYELVCHLQSYGDRTIRVRVMTR